MQVNRHVFHIVAMSLTAASLLGCASVSSPSGQITRQPFGTTKEGQPVEIFTLRNASGAVATICTYGGCVVSLQVPDHNGKLEDVVHGFDNLADYEKNTAYFGALIGRYSNRIAKGKFTLDGKEYTLAKNNGPNALHGGLKGFNKAVWAPTVVTSAGGPSLELRYLSKDGEEGYPGNLSVTAVYTLTDDNALKLEFTATTDKETVLSLSHHSYFNLAGKGDILNHVMQIDADKFTPVDSTLIPTGELRPVDGTPFDFRVPTAIGARIKADDEQIKVGNGYDHNWVIAKAEGKLGRMARVYEPASGRVMEVFSTEPGLQFYTGNFLNGTIKGKGLAYEFRSAFCLEPQHFPDSPNKPEFPSSVLKPGETFKSTIIYKFSVQK